MVCKVLTSIYLPSFIPFYNILLITKHKICYTYYYAFLYLSNVYLPLQDAIFVFIRIHKVFHLILIIILIFQSSDFHVFHTPKIRYTYIYIYIIRVAIACSALI